MRRRVPTSMLNEQQCERCRERPLESFRVNPLPSRREFVFGQRREPLLVNGFESLAFRTERSIDSAGRLGNCLQARFVQVRLNELAGFVLHEATALFGWDRNLVAVWPCLRRQCRSSSRRLPPLSPQRARCLRGPRRR